MGVWMVIGEAIGRLIVPPGIGASEKLPVYYSVHQTGDFTTTWTFTQPMTVLQTYVQDENILVLDGQESGWYPLEVTQQVDPYTVIFYCQAAPDPVLLRYRVIATPSIIRPTDDEHYYIALGEGNVD